MIPRVADPGFDRAESGLTESAAKKFTNLVPRDAAKKNLSVLVLAVPQKSTA
jgi:hypothetical protein